MGEETRVGMPCGHGGDFRHGCGKLLECDGVAADYPYQCHHDYHDARQDGADEEPPAGYFRYDGASLEGQQGSQPVDRYREDADELAVIGEFRLSYRVGDSRCGESEYNRVPRHVLYPLQEDGEKARLFVVGLLDPCIDAAALGRECPSQLGTDQRGGDEEQYGGEENIEKHGQFFLCHHRQSPQADDGRGRHQRELPCTHATRFAQAGTAAGRGLLGICLGHIRLF